MAPRPRRRWRPGLWPLWFKRWEARNRPGQPRVLQPGGEGELRGLQLEHRGGRNTCVFYDTTTGSNAKNCTTGDTNCVTSTTGDAIGI